MDQACSLRPVDQADRAVVTQYEVVGGLTHGGAGRDPDVL
jgi:hypothetical protein